MPYRILSTPEFDEDFSKLSPDSVQRIRDKLRQLAENPQLLRFPLKGLPSSLKGLHKYRVGNYRVLLWPDHNKEESCFTLSPIAERSTAAWVETNFMGFRGHFPGVTISLAFIQSRWKRSRSSALTPQSPLRSPRRPMPSPSCIS